MKRNARPGISFFADLGVAILPSIFCLAALAQDKPQERQQPVLGAGDRIGNGGDLCEQRILSIRDDIKAWIQSGGSKGLVMPMGALALTLETYNERMSKELSDRTTRVECVQGPLYLNPELKEESKVCINAKSPQGQSIKCDRGIFMDKTSESDQYVLIHHEYAGLAGIEVTQSGTSDYGISNQLAGFLDFVVSQKLTLRGDIGTQSVPADLLDLAMRLPKLAENYSLVSSPINYMLSPNQGYVFYKDRVLFENLCTHAQAVIHTLSVMGQELPASCSLGKKTYLLESTFNHPSVAPVAKAALLLRENMTALDFALPDHQKVEPKVDEDLRIFAIIGALDYKQRQGQKARYTPQELAQVRKWSALRRGMPFEHPSHEVTYRRASDYSGKAILDTFLMISSAGGVFRVNDTPYLPYPVVKQLKAMVNAFESSYVDLGSQIYWRYVDAMYFDQFMGFYLGKNLHIEDSIINLELRPNPQELKSVLGDNLVVKNSSVTYSPLGAEAQVIDSTLISVRFDRGSKILNSIVSGRHETWFGERAYVKDSKIVVRGKFGTESVFENVSPTRLENSKDWGVLIFSNYLYSHYAIPVGIKPVVVKGLRSTTREYFMGDSFRRSFPFESQANPRRMAEYLKVTPALVLSEGAKIENVALESVITLGLGVDATLANFNATFLWVPRILEPNVGQRYQERFGVVTFGKNTLIDGSVHMPCRDANRMSRFASPLRKAIPAGAEAATLSDGVFGGIGQILLVKDRSALAGMCDQITP